MAVQETHFTPAKTAAPWPMLKRLVLGIPILGWVLRDLLYGASDNIYYLIVALLSLWAVAVMTWGLVALTVVAVAFVPVMFCILILITWG